MKGVVIFIVLELYVCYLIDKYWEYIIIKGGKSLFVNLFVYLFSFFLKYLI